MNCREFVEFLIDYVEGSLPESQLVLFQEHMRLCPPCVAYLESYCQCIAMGKTVCQCQEEDTPADVPDQLITAILEARRIQREDTP